MKTSHLTDKKLQVKLDDLEAWLEWVLRGYGKGEEFWHTQGLIDIVCEEMDRREAGREA